MTLTKEDLMIKGAPGESEAKQLQNQADVLREQSKHLESIKLLNKAIKLYQKEKDYRGEAGANLSRLLNYKHLALQTGEENYLSLTKQDGEAALRLAEERHLDDLLGLGHFHLAEAFMISKDYSTAAKHFRLALDHFHGPAAEKGDYLYHLGEALYRGGSRDQGRQLMQDGLKEIRSNAASVTPFLTHVWESGCLMKLADLTREDNYEEARKYLQAAKEIIEADDKLVIRRRQWSELAQKFN